MSEKSSHARDEEHRPFAVLIASRPPSQAGRARSGAVSLVLHGLVGFGLVWATMAMAEEVTEEAEDPIYVELVEEMEAPPPPPPPPPPDMPPPVVAAEVFRGFQTLELPTVIVPEIPPPSMTEFRAADFRGEGVQGGRAEGREAAAEMESVEPSADTPSFTPYTVRPTLTNQEEVTRALVREYPAILRDAGIGGSVVVWLFIDVQGRVETTRVHTASGYAQLDEAALRVASVMRFTPAQNRDVKVPVWVSIPVTFRVG